MRCYSIFLSIFFLTLLRPAFPQPSCLPTCRFTLCKSSTLSLRSPPDIPLTSAICLNDKKIGIAHSGEPYVSLPGKDFLPISVLPLALQQPFTPTFFKTYPLLSGTSSGIGHEVPQQNQRDFLGRSCVALPIMDYQVLSRDGRAIDNIVTRARPLVDCVAFRVSRVDRPAKTPIPVTPLSTPVSTFVPGPTPFISAFPEPSPSLSAESTSDPSIAPMTPDATSPLESTTASPVLPSPSTFLVTNTPSSVPKVSSSETPFPSISTSTLPVFPPIPAVVDVGDTVEFPPSTKVGEKTSFKFKVTVSSDSGTDKEDFYFLSDSTSSMGTAIAEAKERFRDVVEARQVASADVAFGVGYYRDEREDDSFKNEQTITTDETKVQTAIDGLIAQSTFNNRDAAEANLVALHNVATQKSIGWRENSRRILVYIGDAPGHEPTCFVGGDKITRKTVIADLKAKKITVVAVSFPGGIFSPGLDADTTEYFCETGADGEGAGDGQATAITSATGGILVEADEQEKLIETILSSVKSLPQDLEADVSDCDAAGVDVSFEPALPVMISPGESATVTETVQISRSVCGDGGSGFSCRVTFTLSGSPIGTQTLSSTGVAGC